MCGIVTLFAADGCPIESHTVLAMRDSIVHRGPDDAGLYIGEGIGLGHRRLSIIDLSTGHQPMSDSEGRVWLVFNGEIYNYKALQRRFSQRGYSFQTSSDTEVIIAAYLLEGDRFPELLNGIFALALWDSRKRRLLLARDRMGVKPLYLWEGGGLLAAASEIKAFMKVPAFQPEVEWDLVPEYLAFRQLAGNKTLFRNVRCLGPGEMLIAERGGTKTKTYWQLPRCVDGGQFDAQQLEDQLDGLLQDACGLQLMSDVPLGTYLSGGVDSSLVTALVADGHTDALNTFSVGLGESGYDERPFAQLVADRFQTRHSTLLIEDEQFADSLPRVIWHHDEPLNHPNTVPMYLLSREAKKRVTVVLTGEGADELFAGYPRYRMGMALHLLGPVGRTLLQPMAAIIPTPGGMKSQRVLVALRKGPRGAVMEAGRYVSDDALTAVVNGEWTSLRQEREPLHPLTGSLVARMLEQDQRNYLMSVLNRLDKASMAFGVEARVPILDHRLVEFAARVPPKLKLPGRETKFLFKRVAMRRLPNEVVYRRKSGLALPLRKWLTNQRGMGRYLDLLVEPLSLQRGFLNPKGVKALVQSAETGRRGETDLVWGLVNLEIWLREMIDSTPES